MNKPDPPDSNKPYPPQIHAGVSVPASETTGRKNKEEIDIEAERVHLGGIELIQRPIPIERVLPSISYEELHAVFDKWLYLEMQDHEVLDVIHAVVIDRDVPGDPVWIYVIAPSGAGKSEYLMSLGRLPRSYPLSALTPQTLVSGKQLLVQGSKTLIPGSKTKENPKGAYTKGEYVLAGILKKLHGKVLVIKDLTVILSMKETDRYEIMSQLRDSADGSYTKAFGNIANPVTVRSTYAVIAGVTPVIDIHQKMTTMLGERFLKIRFHPDDSKTTQRAHQNVGMEPEMREELSVAVASYLIHRDFSNIPDCTEEQNQQIIKMARYIARMRCWVFVKVSRSGEIVDVEVPEAESPTRAVKQLKKLARSLALVRGHSEVTDEDIKTLRRVSKDTGIPKRQKIVETMMMKDERVAWFIRNLSESSGLHDNSVKIECEKMRQLHILREQGDAFSFTPEFIPLVEGVYGRTVPPIAKKPGLKKEEPKKGSHDEVFADTPPVTGANQPISQYEGKDLHVVIDGNEEDEVGD